MRRSNFWIFFLITALIALLFYLNKRKSQETPLSSTETNAPRVVAKPNAPVMVPRGTNTPAAQVVAGNNSTPHPLETTEKQKREELAELNNEDIIFYGQVVDQSDLPVTNAKIAASIRVNNGTRVGVDRFSITSDGNGLFTISGCKGESLGIWVIKSGYVMGSTSTSFVYSHLWSESQRMHPDPSNPTVIKMWKLQGAEPLINISKTYKLRYTDAPINFDLIKREVVSAGGDLTITVSRPPGEVSEHNPQKWSINFAVVEGGFIETSDKEWGVTYAAPKTRYQAIGTFVNNNGPESINEALFIQSRNGQIYSKLGFTFHINKAPDGYMNITFNGVANANNSRNWEGDPNTMGAAQ